MQVKVDEREEMVKKGKIIGKLVRKFRCRRRGIARKESEG